MGFIIGITIGLLASRIIKIGYEWYVWYTYKDNIILWSEELCFCGDELGHGE